jgi:hypothetical protein
MWRRHPSTRWILCLSLLACGAALFAADRPARVITPDGSPLWLDPQRTLVFDSPSVTVMQRNENSEPVNYALRIWVFDERTRLKATQDFCTYDKMGGHTRGRIIVPLEVDGFSLRDSTVVSVSSAASGKVRWTLREDARGQLDAALAAARGSGGRLTFDEQPAGAAGWSCGCDCQAVEAACEQRCAPLGRASSTCNRTFDGGCSAACTCK